MLLNGLARTRTLTRLFFLAAGGLILLAWLFIPNAFSQFSFPTSWVNHRSSQALFDRQVTFWNNLFSHLESNAPNCPSPKPDGLSGAIGFNAIHPPERPNLIEMPGTHLLSMRDAHFNFLEAVRHSNKLRPVFVPKTRGVVYAAGGKYLPVLVISLRMLRRTGSKLPVEVFLRDPEEYEEAICDEVLPSLNAKCVVLSNIPASASQNNTATSSTVEIAHYQLKVFAMLFSSFEEIIWIDADCFPLYPPEQLFDSEPFKSTGMVTWPDYWASTVSPQYYLISQLRVPPMNLRASSETGELMISKRSHPLTLLLSAYYNYYGPSHYFSLLSQGAPGEGDKETFIQAASAVDEAFYATQEPVGTVGHSKPEGGLAGSAMIQFDPRQDYHLTLQQHHNTTDRNSLSLPDRPRAFFIHAHFPKFNPATIFNPDFETRPTYKPDGSDVRAWLVGEDTLRRFGYDIERRFWTEIKWVACALEHKFRSWEGESGICKRVVEYFTNVFDREDPNEVPKFDFSGWRR